MRLLSVLVLLTATLGMAASAHAAARPGSAPGTFTMFNPCTGEDVTVTVTDHFLVFQHGDITHSSQGTGMGVTSGTEYRYIRRGFETNMQGFFEVVHLISVGSGSDLTLTDDLGDAEDPVITCS